VFDLVFPDLDKEQANNQWKEQLSKKNDSESDKDDD
jgi:Lon-like ATP-dependent protease